MSKEKKSEVIVVAGREVTPKSKNFLVSPHVVDGGKNFRGELGRLNTRIEKSLINGRDVSLLGIDNAGAITVGALLECPEVMEVVTLASRLNLGTHRDFAPINERFERDSINWLEEYATDLTPEVRRKITTVYLKDDSYGTVPMHAAVLDGARPIGVKYNNGRGYQAGLGKLLEQPVDIYFNSNSQSS